MYYARKAVVHAVKRLLGRRTYPSRYDQLLREVGVRQPRYILEIGTNDGLNAVRLYREATRHRRDVIYYGFDQFEEQDRDSYIREFALRVPPLESVERHLKRKGVKNFRLVPGDTRKSLPAADIPMMDLIFIDGGHSEETVAADWENVQRLMHDGTIVYFDDYPNWGIGPVVDSIDRRQWRVEILPVWDEFPATKEFGAENGVRRFYFARVSRLGGA